MFALLISSPSLQIKWGLQLLWPPSTAHESRKALCHMYAIVSSLLFMLLSSFFVTAPIELLCSHLSVDFLADRES